MPTEEPKAKPKGNPQAKGKSPRTTPRPIAPFHVRCRYPVDDAALYLGQSPAKTWIDIKEERLRVIRDGGRTFVPGSEIARLSSLPKRQKTEPETAAA